MTAVLPSGLNRPHVEFAQAQNLHWRRTPPGNARPDARYKTLSADAQTGACSCVIRYAKGWVREGNETLAAAETIYVLEGELEVDGVPYGSDHFGHWPARCARHRVASPQGAVVLTFFDARPDYSEDGADPAAQALHLNVLQMAWETQAGDGRLTQLGLARKHLLQAPDGSRCFLTMLLPQPDEARGRGPSSAHAVVEECYVLAGSLVGPHGEMQAGAYLWRPPGTAQGPFGTRWGGVALIRLLGGAPVSPWREDEQPFRFDAPFRPVLPPELEGLRDLGATKPPVRY